VEGIRTFTGTRTKEIAVASSMERESASKGKKTNKMKYIVSCRLSCYGVLSVDTEDLTQAISSNRKRGRMVGEE
jgi:hypothetical protein